MLDLENSKREWAEALLKRDMDNTLSNVKYSSVLMVKSAEDIQNSLNSLEGAITKASNSSKWLTVGLVSLGIAQVIVAALPFYNENQEISVRKNCFQTVLQTSNIDLNYKNCLRDHGLSEN